MSFILTGGRNFDTRALFCQKDTAYCKREFDYHPPFTNHKGSNLSKFMNKFDLSITGIEVKLCKTKVHSFVQLY